LGHLTRKNPSPIWPVCVWWDIKSCSIHCSIGGLYDFAQILYRV